MLLERILWCLTKDTPRSSFPVQQLCCALFLVLVQWQTIYLDSGRSNDESSSRFQTSRRSSSSKCRAHARFPEVPRTDVRYGNGENISNVVSNIYSYMPYKGVKKKANYCLVEWTQCANLQPSNNHNQNSNTSLPTPKALLLPPPTHRKGHTIHVFQVLQSECKHVSVARFGHNGSHVHLDDTCLSVPSLHDEDASDVYF